MSNSPQHEKIQDGSAVGESSRPIYDAAQRCSTQERPEEEIIAPAVPSLEKDMVVIKEDKVSRGPDTLPSVVSPSAVDRIKRATRYPSSTVISRGSAVGNGRLNEYDYPPQPKQKDGEKYQPCAICSMPLELPTLTMRDWMTHVDQDIEPYVCISEECAAPPRFFPSLQSWMDHMQMRHSMNWSDQVHTERWFCNLNHNEPDEDMPEFDDKLDFLDHSNTYHEGQLSRTRVMLRLFRDRRIAGREPFVCPLCDCVPPDIEKRKIEKPYKLLWEHIAQPLKSLSFLSLSYIMEDPEDKESIANSLDEASDKDDADSSTRSISDYSDSGGNLYCNRESCDCAEQEKNSTLDWSNLEATFKSIAGIPMDKLPLSHDDPSYSPSKYEGHAKDKILMHFFEQDPIRDQYGQEEDMTTLNWLNPVDYSLQQNDYIKQAEPGTCQWFLNSTQFLTWVNSHGQTLFSPGIPGAGKTVLTSVIIHNLHTKFQNDDTIRVVYIYGHLPHQRYQDAADLIANLLKQLAQNRPSLPDCVKSLYNKHKAMRTRPLLEEISTALRSVAALYSKVFVFVDALDEHNMSNDYKILLTEIFALQAECKMNILATSRFIPEIVENFSKSMSIEIRASKDDIGRYIEAHMDQLPQFLQKDSPLQEEIISTLSDTCDGMFLLAPVCLHSLADNATKDGIKKALKGFQWQNAKLVEEDTFRALSQVYDPLMKRIVRQTTGIRDLAMNTLSWVTCANRILTASELQHALAVRIGESELDQEDILEMEDVISACAGLVTIVESSNDICFAHNSAKAYFERARQTWFPDAETKIADICVTYLSFRIFDIGCCGTDREFEGRLQLNKLYDYAAHNWGHHTRNAVISMPDVVEFLNSEGKVEASIQALMVVKPYSEESGYSQKYPKQMSGLHLAAYFGIDSVIRHLLENLSPNSRDSYNRTPLSWAAKNGHKAVVKLLLSTAVVKLLLSTGQVEVDSKDDLDRTPLWWATENSHDAVCKLLLATGQAGIKPMGGTSQLSPPVGQISTKETIEPSGIRMDMTDAVIAPSRPAAAEAFLGKFTKTDPPVSETVAQQSTEYGNRDTDDSDVTTPRLETFHQWLLSCSP
ncbi:hypothetical protein GGI43DRAFT_431693 [Trichoderma evansii]